jgi:hypothetical protein
MGKRREIRACALSAPPLIPVRFVGGFPAGLLIYPATGNRIKRTSLGAQGLEAPAGRAGEATLRGSGGECGCYNTNAYRSGNGPPERGRGGAFFFATDCDALCFGDFRARGNRLVCTALCCRKKTLRLSLIWCGDKPRLEGKRQNEEARHGFLAMGAEIRDRRP